MSSVNGPDHVNNTSFFSLSRLIGLLKLPKWLGRSQKTGAEGKNVGVDSTSKTDEQTTVERQGQLVQEQPVQEQGQSVQEPFGKTDEQTEAQRQREKQEFKWGDDEFSLKLKKEGLKHTGLDGRTRQLTSDHLPPEFDLADFEEK